MVEVNGRDRPGLLHDVTAAISEQGLQIASAHVTTYGVRAVDVFYVKDVFGLKVENERKLRNLREALLKALGPGIRARPFLGRCGGGRPQGRVVDASCGRPRRSAANEVQARKTARPDRDRSCSNFH